MDINIFTFILIYLLLFIVYWIIPKVLTPIERTGCYLISVIIVHDWVNIATVNLHILELSQQFYKSMIFSINKIFLFPITLLLFLEVFLFVNNRTKKIVVMILGISTILFLDFSNKRLGIITYTNWTSWNTLLFWLSFSILLYSVFRLFHYLQKER
ncbi:MAG: hypothetical protein ABF649_00130 [Bacillus sp. (in: firmicutes)]